MFSQHFLVLRHRLVLSVKHASQKFHGTILTTSNKARSKSSKILLQIPKQKQTWLNISLQQSSETSLHHFSRTFFPNTLLTTPFRYSSSPNTSLQHYSQHLSTWLLHNTLPQHVSATLLYSNAVQHCSTTVFPNTFDNTLSNTSLLHFSATLLYNSLSQHIRRHPVQHFSTTRLNNSSPSTSLQESSPRLRYKTSPQHTLPTLVFKQHSSTILLYSIRQKHHHTLKKLTPDKVFTTQHKQQHTTNHGPHHKIITTPQITTVQQNTTKSNTSDDPKRKTKWTRHIQLSQKAMSQMPFTKQLHRSSQLYSFSV